ncbi:hypothetical protein ACFY2J_38765 [Streptomyces collinus]|uniref:hypothetical protein n=1 Tax=Streptomyces collinus TaxID=42684 RepID=UPI0036BF6EDE
MHLGGIEANSQPFLSQRHYQVRAEELYALVIARQQDIKEHRRTAAREFTNYPPKLALGLITQIRRRRVRARTA